MLKRGSWCAFGCKFLAYLVPAIWRTSYAEWEDGT